MAFWCSSVNTPPINSITIITRSRTPFVWPRPSEQFAYVNEMGLYTEPEDTFRHFKNAILRVHTPYAIFVDDDDPFPTGIHPPTNAAILVGDEFRDRRRWSKARWKINQLLTPIGIHKCVFSVPHAKLALTKIPDGPWYPEWIIYSTLALAWGWEYDKNFIYKWNQSGGNGHHKEVTQLIRNTEEWINNNQSASVAKLRRIAIT